MAKYRHRVFEMYEFRDEAALALTPRTARSPIDTAELESWSFTRLAVSCREGIVFVNFKPTSDIADETADGLTKELSDLAGKLVKDSKVVIDFDGVTAFHHTSIEALTLFNRKLQFKGSRMALCRLDPAVQEPFFVRSNSNGVSIRK